MRLLLLTGMAALTACTLPEPRATTTGPEAEAVTNWLADYTAAVNAGDLDGILTLYLPDAISIPPTEPAVSGLDALRDWYVPAFEGYTLALTASVDEVIVAADLAVLRTTYDQQIVPKVGGEPTSQQGSWVIVLRRASDGTWRLWRDIWSELPAVRSPES